MLIYVNLSKVMRMCIAMAWPDNPPIQIEAFDLGIEFPNETFPSDPKPPKSQWVHGNVTMNNSMHPVTATRACGFVE